MTREEARRYLANRAQKSFNVIQAVALAEFDGLRTPNRYGVTPLFDADPARPNEEYFAHIDEVVRMAIENRVKRLFTFHHDPSHDDRFISGMLMRARQLVESARSPLLVDAAREGLEVTLQAGVVAAS